MYRQTRAKDCWQLPGHDCSHRMLTDCISTDEVNHSSTAEAEEKRASDLRETFRCDSHDPSIPRQQHTMPAHSTSSLIMQPVSTLACLGAGARELRAAI